MSNVIKSSFVCINSGEATRLINSIEEVSANNQDVVQNEEKTIVTRDLAQSLRDKERVLRDEEANLKIRSAQVMEEANKRAEKIISEAEEKAKDILENAKELGKEEGHQIGISQGREEIEQLRKDLENQKNELDEKYNEMITKFEMDFVDNFILVFEKISGIMIDDKKDVILHLINQQISEVEKSDHYLIRVAKEDYELVNDKKHLLYDYVSEDATIEIVESDNLSRNKCLIETDNSVIDCSIDTQMKNLITDLKMLSRK